MDPDKYYRYTLKELDFVGKAYENKIMTFQAIEHSVYDSQVSMEGKKLFKENTLRKKFPLLYKSTDKILKGDEANNFLQSISKKN